MTEPNREIQANFDRFSATWPSELFSVQTELSEHEGTYLESYERITSINAWHVIIDHSLPEGARRFFDEAHNDAISSHVFARLGAWRIALKSLRSCIENVLSCHYYKDHLVELRLWEQQKYTFGFSKLISYYRSHPEISGLPDDLAGLDRLEKEYATLSRAVHGSSPSFRMTASDGLTNLWSSEQSRLGAWATREKLTLTGINLLLVALHSDQLSGTSFPGLRSAISSTVGSSAIHEAVRNNLNVNLS